MRWRRGRPPAAIPPPLPPDVAEALLDGEEVPDLPEAYVPVAEALAAARRLGAAPLHGEEEAVATFRAVHPTAGRSHGRLRSLSRTGRIGVAAAAAVLVTGASAAAATGHLPAPVQRAASHWLSHAGIHVPATPGGSAPAAPRPPGPTSIPSTTVPATTTTSTTTPRTSTTTTSGGATRPTTTTTSPRSHRRPGSTTTTRPAPTSTSFPPAPTSVPSSSPPSTTAGGHPTTTTTGP